MEDRIKKETLAREVAEKLDEPDNVGMYYNVIVKKGEATVKNILSWLDDYPNPVSKGRLFFWKLRTIEENSTLRDESVETRQNLKALEDLKTDKLKGF